MADHFADNNKELTVRAGELIELLDDKRSLWVFRNAEDQIGYVPVTKLRQFVFTMPRNFNQNKSYDSYEVNFFVIN